MTLHLIVNNTSAHSATPPTSRRTRPATVTREERRMLGKLAQLRVLRPSTVALLEQCADRVLVDVKARRREDAAS